MFKPLNNRLLIKPDEKKEKSVSGIIIPGSEDKSMHGVVVVGTNLVAVDDKVVFSKYGYDEVEIDGQNYYLVHEDNILGIY